MQLSAEARWFWRTSPPNGLQDWFCNAQHHGCSAGGGQISHDEYLRDGGDLELGIKRRDGNRGVEIKGLIGTSENGLAVGPFKGTIQLWGKWTSTAVEFEGGSIVVVEKQRWVRRFSTMTKVPAEIALDAEERPVDEMAHPPARACCVELTKITLGESDIWWSFSFEAVGGVRTVEDDLRHVATLIADRWRGPCLDGLQASYPAWLKEHALEALVAHV